MSPPKFDHYTPLKYLRVGALFFSFAWGIIGLGIAIGTALANSNQEEDALRNQLPNGVSVNINTNDVSRTAIIIVVLCIVIALLSLIYLLILLFPLKWPKSHKRLSTSTLVLQWESLGFFALWLFAVQIPFTLFFNTHAAQLQASIEGFEVPPQLVSEAESLLGIDLAYKTSSHLKLLAIIPWFTFLFTAIAATVSFMAYRRAKAHDLKKRGKRNRIENTNA